MIHKKVPYHLAVKVISFLFVLLFVYAAASKLLDYETFILQLAQSPLLSAYAGIIAWSVPGLEIIIAILLILPRYRKAGLYASFFLMVLFTTYIYIILNYADFIPCSCGGVLEKMTWEQHFIFNVTLIILSAGVLLLGRKAIVFKKLLILGIMVIFGVGTVSLLFGISENKMHRNNAFQRRYMPHPIEKTGTYGLEYNSYYIAGIDTISIYLGNYKAPLYIKAIDTTLKSIDEFPVSISNTELPYRKVRIFVEPPYFYVGDGTVPVLFKGKIKGWNSFPVSYDEVYYSQFTVADPARIGIVTTSSNTYTTVLGLLKTTDANTPILNDDIIAKQVDGIFGADGFLLWNKKHKKFIYVYRYRNTYEVADKYLNFDFTGKTIDTVSKAIVDITYYNRKKELKLGGNSIVINKGSSTYGDYLYIHSDRLGRYEDEEILKTAGIIDVYNINENTYAFSFYLYHQPGKAIQDFKVYKSSLIAIVDDTLWTYRLKPEYFNTGSNKTHTAQYQE